MSALTREQLLELLRVYRQTYADGVIAHATGKPAAEADAKVAECVKAEQAILNAVFPQVSL